MRLIWSLQAIEDVEAIRTYVARDSEQYANLLIDRIIAAVDRLEGFPLSGRVVPEVGDESLREVIYRNYRSVYRLKPEIIEIVTVFLAARLLRLE
jgi:plasmid stabilization system protein ParE